MRIVNQVIVFSLLMLNGTFVFASNSDALIKIPIKSLIVDNLLQFTFIEGGENGEGNFIHVEYFGTTFNGRKFRINNKRLYDVVEGKDSSSFKNDRNLNLPYTFNIQKKNTTRLHREAKITGIRWDDELKFWKSKISCNEFFDFSFMNVIAYKGGGFGKIYDIVGIPVTINPEFSISVASEQGKLYVFKGESERSVIVSSSDKRNHTVLSIPLTEEEKSEQKVLEVQRDKNRSEETKNTLTLIAKKVGIIEIPALDNASSYLKLSLDLSFIVNEKIGNLFPDNIVSLTRRLGKLGGGSMSFGGSQTIRFGDGTISYNGRTESTRAKNFFEVKTAITNGHWRAVMDYLDRTAIASVKKMLKDNNEEDIRLLESITKDKTKTSSVRDSVSDIYYQGKIKIMLANGNKQGAENMLCKFKEDSTQKKEKVEMIFDYYYDNKMMQDCLNLIDKYLEKGYSKYANLAKKLFHYYFQAEKESKVTTFENSTVILRHCFSEGYTYETLARKLFDHYFYRGELTKAEVEMMNHFSKGYTSYENLATKLFDQYCNANDFITAERMLNKHFSRGYTKYNTLDKVLGDRRRRFRERERQRERKEAVAREKQLKQKADAAAERIKELEKRLAEMQSNN